MITKPEPDQSPQRKWVEPVVALVMALTHAMHRPDADRLARISQKRPGVELNTLVITRSSCRNTGAKRAGCAQDARKVMNDLNETHSDQASLFFSSSALSFSSAVFSFTSLRTQKIITMKIRIATRTGTYIFTPSRMRIIVRGRIIASRKTLATRRVKKDHLLPRAGQGHLVHPANRDGADAAERDGDFETDCRRGTKPRGSSLHPCLRSPPNHLGENGSSQSWRW